MTRLDDGFSTTLSFEDDTDVQMAEITVTPPGVDGGGGIDITTMQNSAFRTMAPKSLKTLSPVSATVSYDVDFYTEILSMVNANQLITVNFPGAKTVAFYGFINSFTPSEVAEGEQPRAELEIIVTNVNDSGVETGPVIA